MNQIQSQRMQRRVAFVKKTLVEAEGGHDWFHIERVWKNALLILKDEPSAEPEIVSFAALLHDIADSKFNNGDETIGPEIARQFLESEGVEEEKIREVELIIRNISFKGGKEISPYSSLELQIVQDADRLDAIGAIGVARAFNYGGFKGRKLYDPEVAPNLEMTKEEYKSSAAPTLNHFYEKLLLLKDRMNTATGKKLAEERHVFMEKYLTQFFKEWQGETDHSKVNH